MSSDSNSSDDDFNMVQATPQAVMATATQVRGRVRPASKLYYHNETNTIIIDDYNGSQITTPISTEMGGF